MRSLLELDPAGNEDLQAARSLSLPQDFEMYNHAFFTRLTSALSETFNSVQRLMGTDSFREFSHGYISSRPSTDYLLADYGQSFPDFLSRSAITLERPLLAELARFEWQVQRLAQAPPQETIPVYEVLKTLQTEDCHVRFIDAMVIFQSTHGVYDFWRDTLDPQKNPENLLIFRRSGRVHVERLSVAEVRLLKGLQEGQPLSHALNAIFDLIHPSEIQNLLHRLADRETIEDLLILET